MNNLKYILSGNKKAPIKYIKTGCDLYIEEICCELNGHSNQHDALVAMNAELVEALEYHSNADISHERREYEFNLKIRAEGLNNG